MTRSCNFLRGSTMNLERLPPKRDFPPYIPVSYKAYWRNSLHARIFWEIWKASIFPQ
jgi:hypothetical protein